MLRQHLSELMGRYKSTATALTNVRIVDLNTATHDDRGQLAVTADAFRTVEQFESNFEDLMKGGHPWLNLSYLGTIGGHDIVGVETPTQAPQRAANVAPSVNYSGPPKMVCKAGGDASSYLVVRGEIL